MPEEKKIPELGLAEFVSTLIRETFDAILTAQEEQSAKIVQIHELADSSPENIAADVITPEEVELGMQRFFPLPDKPYCAVYDDAAYHPEPNESPAIYQLTGYEMQKGDFGNNRITAQGLAAIKRQVMFVLAADKLQQIRQMIRNGIPQIHIDNGKILAKVTFSVRETETEGTRPPATVGALPSTFLQRIDLLSGKTLKRIQLPAARMMVKQATESGTTSANNTSSAGEVEIHFRSIL